MSTTKVLKRKDIIVFITLAVMSLIIPFALANVSLYVGYIIIIVIIAFPVVFLILKDYRYGIYSIFLYGSFLFLIDRLIKPDIPFGVLFDFLVLLTFLMLIVQLKGKGEFEWKFNEPIVIAYIIFYMFFTLEIANPAGSIKGWVASARFYTVPLMFYTFIHYFNNKSQIKFFLNFWMVILFMVAAYGIWQEYFGFWDFEWRWIRETPTRYNLYFIWGRMRKFSFLSDPSAYGLFLAFGSLASMSLAFGPFSRQKKILYTFLTLISLFGMSFAGTRTAYAMVAIGIVFFIVLNLRNTRILIGACGIVVVLMILLFGPFYNAPLNRMRSTLNINEDASMNVRDRKRLKFQPYIQSHPIGGGLNTAGNSGLKFSRGHPLAGQFDPDSGYLRTAMEMGWIGLIIFLGLNAAIVITGVQNAFALDDPLLKTYNLAFVVPFFGLTVAHYAQDAIWQKPMNVLVVAVYALMIKLKDIKD